MSASTAPADSCTGTRAEAVVDVDAIRANTRLLLDLMRSRNPAADGMAGVKADGYGHGADGCAGAALDGGATRLAVAAAIEAEQIGRRFQHVPLLTMGALTVEEVDAVISAGSELALWREDFRRVVVNAVLWTAKVDVPESGAKVDFDPADLNRNLDKKGKGEFKPILPPTKK